MLCSSFSYRVFIIFRPLKFKKRAKRVNELKYKQIKAQSFFLSVQLFDNGVQ